MILTEEEAGERWCPFARLSDEDGGTFNRTFGKEQIPSKACCLGAACMAWRFIITDEEEKAIGKGSIEVYSNADLSTETVGYCALAGKPRGL